MVNKISSKIQDDLEFGQFNDLIREQVLTKMKTYDKPPTMMVRGTPDRDFFDIEVRSNLYSSHNEEGETDRGTP